MIFISELVIQGTQNKILLRKVIITLFFIKSMFMDLNYKHNTNNTFNELDYLNYLRYR